MKKFTSIELFAGAGGLALGIEQAGFNHIALNELDKSAAKTLSFNRPEWNVINEDIKNVEFSSYSGIDLLSGGFPCQAFSYAGKQKGMEEARGTLFYDFARAVKETNPKIFIAENVKGLKTHDKGRTLETIVSVFKSLGYTILTPKVLKAINYNVPQKRERIFIVGIRSDLPAIDFSFPEPSDKILTLSDALKAGSLYDSDVPHSEGQSYSASKRDVLSLVPPGGCWRDLPVEIQKSYMMRSFYLSGGRTGFARRIAWNEPSLTLTCSPAQKQTERCHPDLTRPFTIREYARIQTFPDNWEFIGSISNQYKQIGNAVPVNLSYAIGVSAYKFLEKNHEE